MKIAVIFSVTIFDPERAWMMDKWVEALNKDFSDADFYFGVNPGTNQTVVDKLLRGLPNLHGEYVKPELYCESDASAYQAALKALKRTGKKYDYYWFIHTKGGVNIRYDRFEYYLNEFVGKRKEIEEFLLKNPSVGSYGHYGVGQSADGHTQWKTLNHLEFDHAHVPIVENVKTNPLSCTHINWSYVETLFIMKGDPVNWLIENASDDYFNTKIRNRWYFEVVFPWLSSRFGLYPYVKYPLSQFAPIDLNITTKEWERENGLSITIAP